MPPLLQLKKLPEKVDGAWKKVSLCRFLADQKLASSWKKNAFWGHHSGMSNKLMLVARHIMTTGLQKYL